MGYNEINNEIRQTLLTESKDRFVLMNNGVTIIARSLQTVGNKFSMSDFQVVNGCQTSHVLHYNKDLLQDVNIPFRIVGTQDNSVIKSIIRATNRQTAAKEDQFFAMKPFAKKLEEYFRAFPPEHRLYYERRAHQYDSQDIDKRRIIPHQNLVRAVGAMFLEEPHITTRNFRALSAKVGKEFFLDTDKLEPYYVAALTAYRLENMFYSEKIVGYKPARYQMLLAARLTLDAQPLPRMNSNEMAKRCNAIIDRLAKISEAEKIFIAAAGVIDTVAGADWTRDSIRTEPVTKAILSHK